MNTMRRVSYASPNNTAWRSINATYTLRRTSTHAHKFYPHQFGRNHVRHGRPVAQIALGACVGPSGLGPLVRWTLSLSVESSVEIT